MHLIVMLRNRRLWRPGSTTLLNILTPRVRRITFISMTHDESWTIFSMFTGKTGVDNNRLENPCLWHTKRPGSD